MSLFNFTRREQMTILFLTFALLVGGVVILIKHHRPGFAPELLLEEQAHDTTLVRERDQQPSPSEGLLLRKVNINRATVDELMELPGIGPKTARLIVAYRAERGGFRSLKDLKEVKGIGDKTLEQLRPFIKIE